MAGMKELWKSEVTEASIYDRLIGAVSGWLPFLFLLVVLPTQIYLSNTLDFEFDWTLLIPYFLSAIIVLFILFLFGVYSHNYSRRIFDALFFLGVFLIISDAFVPLDWGLLDGGHSLNESWISVIVQLLIGMALVLLFFKVPTANIRVLGGFLVVGLIAWQAFMLPGLAAAPIDESASSDEQSEPIGRVRSGNGRPNVYHIVFDGYASPNFLASAERTGLLSEFSGFTLFERNLSNFLSTDASVPSYLTGKLYAEGSFKEFQLSAKRAGLGSVLMDKAYRMSVYAPNRTRFWSHDNATSTFTNDDLVRDSSEKLFALVLMVRSAPELLRKEAFKKGSQLLWGGQSSYSYYKRLSVPVFERFLEDERARSETGRYTYVHLILPHSPYVWDANCGRADESDFDRQTDCATVLMGRLIQELKSKDRYEDSLIIFQSDHGTRTETYNEFPMPGFPDAVSEHLRASMKICDPQEVFERAHSLLLIKPPGSATSPIQVSNQLTQLADVPATVFQLLGIDAPDTDGRSVFRGPHGDREVEVYVGVYNENECGKPQIPGRHAVEANLGRIGFSDRSGWQVLTDIRARHEGW